MGGPRVTATQVETATRVYAETGSVREAAAAAGVAHQTLHDYFKRERIGRNRTRHAEACDRGLREGRRSLRDSVALVDSLLSRTTADSPGMEPRDIAALLNAKSNSVATLDKVAARVDAQKLAKLTRAKTRAEIELIRRKISGDHVDRVSLEHLTDDDVDARLAALAAGAAGDVAGGSAGVAGTPRGEGAPSEDP